MDTGDTDGTPALEHPLPPQDAPPGVPDVVLAPLPGWNAGAFRLGYGGGHFERTLAALSPRPFSIGRGLAFAQLPKICPQPHDIPLGAILTALAGPGQ